MAFGLLSTGFAPKTLADIRTELEESFRAAFGAGIPLGPDTAFGKIIGIAAEREALEWELSEALNDAFGPDTATDNALDRVVRLVGLTRLAATRSLVTVYTAGIPAATVPALTLFAVADTLDQFRTIAETTLTGIATVALTALTRSGSTATGTTAAAHGLAVGDRVFIDGAAIAQVVEVNVGTVADDTDYTITINGVAHTITSDSDATAIEIRDALVVAINGGGEPVTAAPGIDDDDLDVTADVAGVSFTLTTTVNLTPTTTRANVTEAASDFNGLNEITATPTTTTFDYVVDPATVTPAEGSPEVTGTTPISCEAVNTGAVGAPSGGLTVIVNAVTGLDRIENELDAAAGRDVETDAELRARRETSLGFPGQATVSAIRARLLEVTNVLEVIVNENVTDSPMTDSFLIVDVAAGAGGSFDIAGDVRLLFPPDGVNTGFTVTGSTGNDGAYTVDTVSLISGDTQIVVNETVPSAVADGSIVAETLPAHSFEAVVDAGDADDIAEKIFDNKAAGIQTFGVTEKRDVIDDDGNTNEIRFSRPQDVDIYVEIDYTLNPEETFPADGEQQIEDAVLAYGNALNVGDDVIVDRIEASAILATIGIATVVARVDIVTPAIGTTNIAISKRARARFDSSRVTVAAV